MPRPTLRLSLALVTSAALLLGATACDKSTSAASEAPADDAVDATTRALLEALAADNRDAAARVSTAELSLDLNTRRVAIIARTFAWLGALEGLSSSEEETLVDGARRRYVARFSRGELTLHVSVVGTKVEGFEFDPGQWSAYEERALTAHAGSMRLLAFHFVGPEGVAVDTPSDPSTIAYAVELEGLDAQLREHHITIGKSVHDLEGHEVYRQDADDNINFPQGEDGASGGTLTGKVAVPEPGSYELELHIRDLVGAQDLTHRVRFTIE